MSAQFILYSSLENKKVAVIRVLGSPVIIDKNKNSWEFEKSYNKLPDIVRGKIPLEKFKMLARELFKMSGVDM